MVIGHSTVCKITLVGTAALIQRYGILGLSRSLMVDT